MRIGIDLGGTKIAGILMDAHGVVLQSARTDSPRGGYDRTIEAVHALVQRLEGAGGEPARVGIGMPGSISPLTGRVQNANSTWLNGKPLKEDLEARLGRPVRLANDANCFALSEAADGAGQECTNVFGVILGTGCGGGLIHEGRIVDGPRGIGGEWGHNPLPWPDPDESPGPQCWCGRWGCMETWVSGSGMAANHARSYDENLAAEQIAAKASAGCEKACNTLLRHASRLARGLACVVNVFDPDCIVLGGGLSNMSHLYEQLPELISHYVFSDNTDVRILPPRHGAESGVRGGAWLWSPSER